MSRFSKPLSAKRGYNEDEVDAFLDLIESRTHLLGRATPTASGSGELVARSWCRPVRSGFRPGDSDCTSPNRPRWFQAAVVVEGWERGRPSRRRVLSLAQSLLPTGSPATLRPKPRKIGDARVARVVSSALHRRDHGQRGPPRLAIRGRRAMLTNSDDHPPAPMCRVAQQWSPGSTLVAEILFSSCNPDSFPFNFNGRNPRWLAAMSASAPVGEVVSPVFGDLTSADTELRADHPDCEDADYLRADVDPHFIGPRCSSGTNPQPFCPGDDEPPGRDEPSPTVPGLITDEERSQSPTCADISNRRVSADRSRCDAVVVPRLVIGAAI